MGVLQVQFDLPAGLATVIGSLPLPLRGAAQDLLPRLPSAPSLVLESDSGPADGTELGGDLDIEVPAVGEPPGFASFLSGLRGGREPVVLSLTGPVTLELDLRRRRDHVGSSAAELVVQRARHLVGRVREVAPGAQLMLFLQEPALANSMHPTFPLGGDEVGELLTDVVGQLSDDASPESASHESSTIVGVQVDGRADWTMLMRTGIGALAAPLGAQLETAAAELTRFLEGGGIMAWGAVPVDEPIGSSAERLWKRLSALWCELARLGVDPMLLRERSIITPSSGLANFGVPQAERVIALTQDLAARVLHQTIGVRLSIGA